MNRAGILKEALLRAAHACLWAEENAVWHTHTTDAPEHQRVRHQAHLRVERVITQAGVDGLLDAAGQRRLLGRVMEALVQVRWRHQPRHKDDVPSFQEIERSLEKDLRKAWSHGVRRLWRIAA